MTRSVLVTGAGGYLGRLVVERLAVHPDVRVTGLDVRSLDDPPPGADHVVGDIRSPELAGILKARAVTTVVHLAAVVTPGRRSDRSREYEIDVLGTRNVLDASIEAGVDHVVVTSSGAAYGYHADNPEWIDEDDALRGNVEFAYSDHKRQVEEMLVEWRISHPEVRQLVFRPGTVLGATTRNQITDLLDGRVVLGLGRIDIPFVLMWDEDVAACIAQGVVDERTGVFNLAGDGAVTLEEMARRMGKPYLRVPVPLLRAGLIVLHRLRLSQYGPEQLDFLRFRPVLSNRRLKEEFGYVPQKTSSETFDYFWAARRGAA